MIEQQTNVFPVTSTQEPLEMHENEHDNDPNVRYVLMNPLEPEHFGISFEEMVESLDEFGLEVLVSHSNPVNGPKKVYFAVAKTLNAMEQMVNSVGLDGVIVVANGIYDQLVQETVKVVH